MERPVTIRAAQVLTGEGWRHDMRVTIGADGRIAGIAPASRGGSDGNGGGAESSGSGSAGGSGGGSEDYRVGLLMAAPVNLHSHAFQRALAGLTERRGPDGQDSFWTWRQQMYRFLDRLTPDDIEAITAFVQMEMLEAGFGAVAEFHYLHHRPDGRHYDDIAELSARVAAAAEISGIGLTLLPVLYQTGGCDGRALGPGQIRFGNDIESFARLHAGARRALSFLPGDCRIGVAPHSLRAVTPEGLEAAIRIAGQDPLHMHLAEQEAEVEEVRAVRGARPVEWLLDHAEITPRWCLIHCTRMLAHETAALAATGAVAGLCPITEASLGDGIFDGARWLAHGGRIGIGSDSNIRISLSEELRSLEYSQRLRDRARAVLAAPGQSTGRHLLEAVSRGGARAAGRDCGTIRIGALADLTALDMNDVNMLGCRADTALDAYVFAGDDRIVTDVWSAGRHLVRGGRHRRRDEIETAYRRSVARLKDAT